MQIWFQLSMYMQDNIEREYLFYEVLFTLPGLKVIKLLSCLAQLSMKCQLLIKTKIPNNKDFSCFATLF